MKTSLDYHSQKISNGVRLYTTTCPECGFHNGFYSTAYSTHVVLCKKCDYKYLIKDIPEGMVDF